MAQAVLSSKRWAGQEDHALLSNVRAFQLRRTTPDWTAIALALGRTDSPEQCRQRYHKLSARPNALKRAESSWAEGNAVPFAASLLQRAKQRRVEAKLAWPHATTTTRCNIMSHTSLMGVLASPSDGRWQEDQRTRQQTSDERLAPPTGVHAHVALPNSLPHALTVVPRLAGECEHLDAWWMEDLEDLVEMTFAGGTAMEMESGETDVVAAALAAEFVAAGLTTETWDITMLPDQCMEHVLQLVVELKPGAEALNTILDMACVCTAFRSMCMQVVVGTTLGHAMEWWRCLLACRVKLMQKLTWREGEMVNGDGTGNGMEDWWRSKNMGWCVRSKRVAAGWPFLITEALAEQLVCWGHLLGLANPPHTIAQGFHIQVASCLP